MNARGGPLLGQPRVRGRRRRWACATPGARSSALLNDDAVAGPGLDRRGPRRAGRSHRGGGDAQGRPGRRVRRGHPRRRALALARRRPAARTAAAFGDGRRRRGAGGPTRRAGSTTPSTPSSTGCRRAGAGPRGDDPSTSRSPDSAAARCDRGQRGAVPVRTTCRLVNHAGSYLERHGVAGEYGLGAPDDGRFDHGAERFGFSGTAPVFRAETLERLGGLEPQFFAYNEDTDWCLRARLAGLRILYDPAATVRHRLSATSQGPRSPMVRFLAQRNALLCLVRNAPSRRGPTLPLATPARRPRARAPAGGADQAPVGAGSRGPVSAGCGRPRRVRSGTVGPAPTGRGTSGPAATTRAVILPHLRRASLSEGPPRPPRRRGRRSVAASSTARTPRPVVLRRRQLLAQPDVLDHLVHRGREEQRLLRGQQEPGVGHRFGDRRGRVGDDGQSVTHGLDQGDTEALVLRRAHEDVGGSVVGLELFLGHGAGDRNGVAQTRARR